MLDGCTDTLKVAVTAVVRDTFEAPGAGVSAVTLGGAVVVKTTSTQ